MQIKNKRMLQTHPTTETHRFFLGSSLTEVYAPPKKRFGHAKNALVPDEQSHGPGIQRIYYWGKKKKSKFPPFWVKECPGQLKTFQPQSALPFIITARACSTIGVHIISSEFSHLKNSVLHPKTDPEKKKGATQLTAFACMA